MKKKSSFAVFLWVILLSLASISVASASSVKTNVLVTKFNAAPSKPTVSIEYPSDSSSLIPETYTIDIFASDQTGITLVKLKIDGPESTNGWVEVPASDTAYHYYHQWSFNTEGGYSITARATNNDGRHADDTVSVTVTATSPAPVHDVAVTGVSAFPTSVEIGENVIVSAIVENQGDFTETFDVTSFYGSVPIEMQTVTGLAAGASSTLTFTWGTTELAEGEYTISAKASIVPEEIETDDNTFIDGTVTVSTPGTPPTATYELFIEIDYIVGHEPTQAVLDYIEDYYMGNNPTGDLINVTFYVDDPIAYTEDYATISDAEFSSIEATYNDHDNGYYSKWKWVLYGTSVENEPTIMGYCSVMLAQVGRRDFDALAGNYIFIADGAADVWATSNGIDPKGAEAAVLMHEFGHSIGIAVIKYHPRWGPYEVYDSEVQSVMAKLSTANAGLINAWYYSDTYWATRNMEYYTIWL